MAPLGVHVDKLHFSLLILQVQMGPLGVHADSAATQALIESAPSGSQVFLASGYFNLTQNYMDVILDKSKADFQILMASPKVNGFYGEFNRDER